MDTYDAMTQLSASYNRKLNNFSKRIFRSCKAMKADTKILTLSWENNSDKKVIVDVLKNLKNLDLIDYRVGFETIKITITGYGKRRLKKHTGWYDTTD